METTEENKDSKVKGEYKFMKKCDVRPASTLQGSTFNKSFGQYTYILRNTDVSSFIIKKAHLQPSDTVVEVAPCTGNLTMKLLEQAQKVIVYEINPQLASTLERRIETNPHRNKLEIIKRNVLKQRLPTFDACVAHVPYQISNAFICKLLKHQPFFKCAVLLLQKGFVKQLIAKPGEKHYCHLSLTMRVYAKVKVLGEVGRENFSPVPPVDYNIVRISQKKKNLPDVSYYEWLTVTETAFKMEDRPLRVIFEDSEMVRFLDSVYEARFGFEAPEGFNMKEKVREILKKTGFVNRKARDMDVNDFVALIRAFLSANIHFF